MRQLAVTVPRSVPLKGYRPQPATRTRVRRVGSEIGHAAILFFQIGLEVVSQTVIERQLTSNLPVVLNKPGVCVAPDARLRGNTNKSIVDAAEQEAGVWKSHGPAWK